MDDVSWLDNQRKLGLSQKSDIQDHCRLLTDMAEECESVVEFGVRYGISTIALLAGILQGWLTKLTSYDINPLGPELELEKRFSSNFQFIKGSSLEVRIPKGDMLFIDTRHTGYQLLQELRRHHTNVRRWIVMHDTEAFGKIGEDGRKGLKYAILLFLRDHPEWFISRHYKFGWGLTILSKWESDRSTEPISLLSEPRSE